jgi:hypothetical protein
MFLKKVSFHAFLMFLGFSLFWVVYATINYSECFPNGCTLFQSLTNGWVTPTSSTSKEIMTPEGCKKVTGWATTNRYFIPTKTLAEWNSFKNHLPWGSSITECPISGVCGGSSNSCSVGTPSGYNPWSCGGSETWTCLGQYGGTNASCSIANPPCPTPINWLCNNAYAWFSPGVPCFAGTSSSYNAGSCGGSATWMCLGQNWGTNDSCNHTNPPCSTPVNGVCGWSVNACNAGTAWSYNPWVCWWSATWTCNGQNGGTNASCSIANPPCCVSNMWASCQYVFQWTWNAYYIGWPQNPWYPFPWCYSPAWSWLVSYSCPANPQDYDYCSVTCAHYQPWTIQCNGTCQ